MKKLNLLSKAEMKKVIGGGVCTDAVCTDPPVPCDASNGGLWTTECRVGGAYRPPSSYFTVDGWNPGAPCGGQCPGDCISYYWCHDQSAA